MPTARRVEPGAAGATRRGRFGPLLALVTLLLVLSALRSPQALLAWFEQGAGGPSATPAELTDRSADAPAALQDTPAVPPPGPLSGTLPGTPPGTGPDGPPGLLIQELRGDWRIAAGSEEAAALAVLAAHAWARDIAAATPPTSRADVPRGPAAISLEAVERPGPSAAVVTILIDLDGDLGAARRAAGIDPGVVRLAFPIDLSAGVPGLAGTPWRLPSPGLEPHAIRTRPITDERLIASARRALDAVGLDGEAMVALEGTDGWPFIARLNDTASSPGGPAPAGDPWLRWHLDRFVVTGVPLQRAAGGHD